jgi:hypothetical protein
MPVTGSPAVASELQVPGYGLRRHVQSQSRSSSSTEPSRVHTYLLSAAKMVERGLFGVTVNGGYGDIYPWVAVLMLGLRNRDILGGRILVEAPNLQKGTTVAQ